VWHKYMAALMNYGCRLSQNATLLGEIDVIGHWCFGQKSTDARRSPANGHRMKRELLSRGTRRRMTKRLHGERNGEHDRSQGLLTAATSRSTCRCFTAKSCLQS